MEDVSQIPGTGASLPLTSTSIWMKACCNLLPHSTLVAAQCTGESFNMLPLGFLITHVTEHCRLLYVINLGPIYHVRFPLPYSGVHQYSMLLYTGF